MCRFKMKFEEILYVIDNDGNEFELKYCVVIKNSKMLTKDFKIKIESGFKIIRKYKGICIQIFIVNDIFEFEENLRFLEISEF